MKNKKLVFWGKLVAIGLLLIVIGYILLVIVYSIPKNLINQHVQESVKIFEREGTYPQLVNGFDSSQLDNWTDALMLLIAAHEDAQNNVFKQAARNAYSEIPGKNPTETLIALYSEDGEIKAVPYERYWHGYLVLLKPLLVFFNYGEIRYLNMAFQLALILGIMFLLTKQNRAQCGAALCFYILSLNPATLAMSMQFSSIFILTMLSGIVLLLREKQYKENIEWLIIHFFVVGCLTSYFDLLTYPLHTLAVSLILWLSISCENRYKIAIESMLAWAAGYGGMWSGKWIVSSLITGDNVLRDAFDQAALRTSYAASDSSFTYGDMISRFFSVFNNPIVHLALIVPLLYIVACMWKHKMRVDIKYFILLGGIALMPFAWYAVLSNHSYWHAWFTYRELAISIFAIQMIAISCNKDYQ